ncbi:MAG: pantoate--beta-alanine ligase [Muribaculaceae bacterium]|nr:pantoate--beta-alanine ligase [Muribaculaceae bacterium]
MEIIRTADELRQRVAELKEQGRTVGFVPTMGALHAGHISLVDKARHDCTAVVVSVFVNPTQFNNQTDLITYPRTEEADCALLEKAGVDIAFIPSVEEMYPTPDTRVFDLGPVAQVMEGPMRPGHFNGVAQVVSKLFDMVRPHKAYFGEKDFQQIAVIRRMVEIEGFDIDIVACPIRRHDDGLAMSSRNVRLTAEQRQVAPEIYKALRLGKTFAAEGHGVGPTKALVTDTINSVPFMKVEYFEIVDADTMQPIADWADASHAAGCITVYCGDVRLIDNIIFF